MALDQTKLIATVENLVALLASRAYGDLERLTDSIRLHAEEIEAAVVSYPGNILPIVSEGDVDAVKIDTAKEECWSVNVRLHTDIEGLSDLTMSLTLVHSDSQHYAAELDGIHVL
jgi:hypothetical protein